jgi:hypothetical protein
VRVQVSKPAMLFYNFDVMYVLKFVMSVWNVLEYGRVLLSATIRMSRK